MGRDFLQDLRFGARTLLHEPAFTTVTVLILGLGIAGPSTVFTLVNELFFERPAHVSEPHRLVRVYRTSGSGYTGPLGYPDYLHYREAASTLAGLAAYDVGGTVVSASTGEGSDQARAAYVSDNYFDVLGVRPVAGRTFRPEENAVPGTHPVVVLSHGFWRRAFAADPDAVGRTLRLNGHTFEVVGVAPEGFSGISPVGPDPDLWVPIMMRGTLAPQSDSAWYERLRYSRTNWLMTVGRMAPGVTFQAAEANLDAASAALDYAGRSDKEGVLLTREYLYRPDQARALESLAVMLLAVVGIVLAIASANVAVLLLSRGAARRREMGVRTALGAGKGRLARQLLAETLLLGLAGGAVGVAVAYLAGDAAASLLPLPVTGDFRPDVMVVGGVTVLVLLVTAVVGSAPAWQAARTDVRDTLQGPRGTGSAAPRGRYALVVAQVALSLVLVSAAVLFGRSFHAARGQPLGFETENRVLAQVNLANHGYGEEEGAAFVRRALERIEALPGVHAATTTTQVPFRGEWTMSFETPPGARPNRDEEVAAGANVVGPDYFEVMGIPLLRGRGLHVTDRPGASPAVVINEKLADDLWPGQDPVGRTLPIRDDTDYTVVGVAADSRYYAIDEEPRPHLWISIFQMPQSRVHFLVHVEGSTRDAAGSVRSALRDVDPQVVVGWLSTMEQVLDDQIARYEVSAVLVGMASAVALLMACIGLYGVVAFLVTRRTREIGVRMALGAPRGRVAGRVVTLALRLAVLGVLLGALAARAMSDLTTSFVFGVEPTDPTILAAAAAILVAATLVAALIPARRATRIDPMQAMRMD